MNENHRLIKDVSNALGFYMNRTRREEGFDLSGILRPAYDLNQFKFNKLFGYSTGYDITMKKALTPQLCLPKSIREDSEEIQLREKFYKDELKYHLRFDKNKQHKQATRSHSQKGFRSRSKNEFVSSHSNSSSSSSKYRPETAKTQRPKVPAGLLTIRSTHTPALTRREKISMVNITSKIMSASSELCFQKEDILLMKNIADAKSRNACYVRKSLSQSRRDEREEYESRLLNRHRDYERDIPEKNKKTNDTSSLQTSDENSGNGLIKFEADYKKKQDELVRIAPVKENSHSRASTKKEDNDEEANNDKQNQLKNLKEITDGDITKYRIVIKTGDRLGSSTEAAIKLRLFGSKGKSTQFKLKDSKTHKIPFRKGNTDVFDLEVYEIGPIKAVHIGHNEKNIESSWFIDYIGVEDQTKNIIYTFETPDWFSTTSGDGQTSRVLFKKNSNSIDSNSSASSDSESSSSSSSSSSSKASTVKLSTKRSDKSSSKKSFSSTSSSSLQRNSTPQSTRNSSRHSGKKSVSPVPNNRAILTQSSTKQSLSASIHNTSDEIASQKFAESPRQDYVAVSSLSRVINLSLFEAVEMNRLDVIKEKLQMSPLDITKTDVSGRTLLIKACEEGFESIVKYLADNSDELISIDTPLGYFPVHVCTEGNKLDCLKILYDYGASLSSKTNLGNTPLHLAAENGHFDIVRWLVDNNANVTIYNNNAETAYELAKRNGHIQVANYLAEPSGIKTLITIDDNNKSPFSRPDEPLPVVSSSSRSNSKLSSRLSSRQTRRSSSSGSSSTSTNSSICRKSKGSKGSKNSKAKSVLRVEQNEYKLEVDRSLNQSKISSKSRNQSSSSAENKRSSSFKIDTKCDDCIQIYKKSDESNSSNSDSDSSINHSKSSKSKYGSVSSSMSRKSDNRINKLKGMDEVTNGGVVKYRVICKTKASTGMVAEDSVCLRLFGSLGKSKEFTLGDYKKSSNLAFHTGNTDIFDIQTYDVGSIKAICIELLEKKIDWQIDYIGLENQTKNIVYIFDTPDLFSSSSSDSRKHQYLFKKNSNTISTSDSNTSISSNSDSDSSINHSKSSKRKGSTSTARSRSSTDDKSPVITRKIIKKYEVSSSTDSSDTEAEHKNY